MKLQTINRLRSRNSLLMRMTTWISIVRKSYDVLSWSET